MQKGFEVSGAALRNGVVNLLLEALFVAREIDLSEDTHRDGECGSG